MLVQQSNVALYLLNCGLSCHIPNSVADIRENTTSLQLLISYVTIFIKLHVREKQISLNEIFILTSIMGKSRHNIQIMQKCKIITLHRLNKVHKFQQHQRTQRIICINACHIIRNQIIIPGIFLSPVQGR